MPELPEVQTTVTGLASTIMHLTIVDLWANSFSTAFVNRNNHKNNAYFTTLRTRLIGKTILDVSRRGKNILINLEGNLTLLVHMKMTGHLLYGVYEKRDEKSDSWPWVPLDEKSSLTDPYNRHIRVVFTLKSHDGSVSHLVFCDPRKFGSIELHDETSLLEKTSSLGPEPLEKNFTLDVFTERLHAKRSGYIKSVLMDQKVLVGVGNIYSDESLYLAHIQPLRDVTSLSDNDISLLHNAIQKVLRSGIDFGGDSMSDYRNVRGERGTFQGKHTVYLRTGKPCLSEECAGTIQKKTIGGRSAHFCPKCQV